MSVARLGIAPQSRPKVLFSLGKILSVIVTHPVQLSVMLLYSNCCVKHYLEEPGPGFDMPGATPPGAPVTLPLGVYTETGPLTSAMPSEFLPAFLAKPCVVAFISLFTARI